MSPRPCEQSRDQFVAGNRNEDYVDSYMLLFPCALLMSSSNILNSFISNALFAAVINKIATQAINGQNPYDTPLLHAIEITGP